MTLANWHAWRKSAPRTLDFGKCGPKDVTVVTYVYGTPEYVSGHFFQIENAIRETWFWLGMLKTVVVTNIITDEIKTFAEEHGQWVRVDVCNRLVPGDLYKYSRDCIANLHKRFDTPYVLFVHPDGFPLRSGIEEFLGEYDYVGAPWIGKDDIWGKLLLSQKHFVGNGGFSLRSHEICEAAASLYNRRWKLIPDCFVLYEDYFFCRLLTKFEPSYAKRFSFASSEDACRFALENFDAVPLESPFGFHSAKAFERLYRPD